MKRLLFFSVILLLTLIYAFGKRDINNVILISVIHFVIGYFTYAKRFSILKNILILESVTYLSCMPSLIFLYSKDRLNFYGVPEIFFSGLVSVSLGILARHYFTSNKWKAVSVTFSWILVMSTLIVFVLPRTFFQHFKENAHQKPPDFSFTSLNQKIISAQNLQNKVVLLDFWDTRCVNCIKQFPEYEKLYQHYKQNPNVKILAVNTAVIDSFEDVQNFKFLKKYSFDFVIDDKATFTKPFNIQAVPQSFLIDKKGIVRLIHSGYSDEEYYAWNMGREIDRLLRE